MTNPPILAVDRLTKGYRRRLVIRAVSFSLPPGAAMALVGPNGAGKSTLIGCITGDRAPDSGSVRICGADAFQDLGVAARCTGFVPERPALYDELTVGELIDFVLAARALDPRAGRAEADRLLRLLGMAGTEDVLCRELSQGMGRKAAIAVALLHRPRLIVLDEAFNGLDRTSADRLSEELSARRADGAAVLASSHDLEFLAVWCDRGLFLAPDSSWTEVAGDAWDAWRSAPSLVL